MTRRTEHQQGGQHRHELSLWLEDVQEQLVVSYPASSGEAFGGRSRAVGRWHRGKTGRGRAGKRVVQAQEGAGTVKKADA